MSGATEDHEARSGTSLPPPLDLLARMAGELAATRDLDATLKAGLGSIIRRIGAEGGAIYLLEDASGELVCHACDGPGRRTGQRVKLGEGIVGQSVSTARSQLLERAREEVAADPGPGARGAAGTAAPLSGSVLCAPLVVGERCVGAIELVNKRGGARRFDEHDRLGLETMAASAALGLCNARSVLELLREERERGERELAAEIQQTLLPAPAASPLPVAGLRRPARAISGDFFDVLVRDDGRIGFAVGRVSGEGTRAALLVAKTASLHRCIGKTEGAPGRLLAILDRELCDTAQGAAVGIVAGIYDPHAGRVRLANAGNEPPLLHDRDGRFRTLPTRGAPLGVGVAPAGDGGFPEDDLRLDGGSLYVFTAGLPEARAGGGERLGRDGVERLVAALCALPLAARLAAISEHAAPAPLADDVTLLAVDGCAAASRPGTTPGEAVHRLLDLRIPARARELKQVREAVREAAVGGGCSPACADDVVIAVDEACQNVIRHAYGGDPGGEMVLEVERRGDRLVVWLRDFARSVDASTVQPRDLDEVRPGGLGVHLIREVMDESDFVPCPSGNILRMVKRIR